MKPETRMRLIYNFDGLLTRDWIVIESDKVISRKNLSAAAYQYARYHGFSVSVKQIIDGSGYLVERTVPVFGEEE